MDEVPTTNLTVAKLKALCVLNDLSAAGKKAELLQRLLDAGVDRETLGMEVFDEESATFQEVSDEGEANDSDEEQQQHEPVMLSLEDEDTLTPSKQETPKKATAAPPATSPPPKTEPQPAPVEDDEVLEAEILDAVLSIDRSGEHETVTPPAVAPPTLKDMLQRPQTVAILLTLLILGAGGWYYVNNQIEPFTADSLRYGDSMNYMITGEEDGGKGTFIATGEYVSLVTDRLEDASDYCKIKLTFKGESEASITDGTSSELFTQTTDDRLGAVHVRGGHGMSWLAVESVNEMQLTQFDLSGHYPIASTCSEFTTDSTSGQASITLKTWKELREQVVLATELGVDATLSADEYKATAFTYGVGGLFGDLEELSPGLGRVVAPVELADFFGNDYITKDATGTSSGWEWRVTGSEKIGTTNMWKVTASHRDVRDFCLGFATMNMWLDAESPWAARQEVDVSISSSDASQSGCSEWQQRGVDAVLPEGELELHHTFDRTSLTRGVKTVELGKAYDNRPQANDLNPDSDDLVNWGVDGMHLPDNSTQRTHPLDEAMVCLDDFSSAASGAVTALENDGYVWRAVDALNGTATEWNISWVATDSTAGWLVFSVTEASDGGLDCEYIAKGTFDDTVAYNRESIPEVLPLHAVEDRLMNSQRFPALTNSEALFSSSGLHPETRIGYLVVVPGTGFGIDFGNLLDTSGATTVDVQRSWEDNGADRTFSALVDATDGRMIGWTSLSVKELA